MIWAALSALVLGLAVGACAGVIWHGGRREGRTDAILERLTAIADDHESRRGVERGTWDGRRRAR